MGRFVGVLGIAVILAGAYVFSTDRRAIKLKTVAWGLGLQFALGLFVLRVPAGQRLFAAAGAAAKKLLDFSYVGSTFIFGELGKADSNVGFIFAFQVLPTIIFIAAFFAVLYHFGVMQIIIRGAAWVMTKIMGASGAESLSLIHIYNVHALQEAVRKIPGGAGTSIYDALVFGSRALEKRGGERRRVIILVTDAGETTSGYDFEAARKAAVRSGALLYTIVIRPVKNENGRNTAGEHALETITDTTGGAMFFPDTPQELSLIHI